MHIQNTSTQFNQFDAIQHKVTSPSLQNPLSLLAKQSGTLDKLAQTHQFADTQIHYLDQEMGEFFKKLDSQLESSSSNTDAPLSTESLALNNTFVAKTLRSVDQINRVKDALVHLKTRDFQPAKNANLSVALSGKAFGGYRGESGGVTSAAQAARARQARMAAIGLEIDVIENQVAEANAQIVNLQNQLQNRRNEKYATLVSNAIRLVQETVNHASARKRSLEAEYVRLNNE